MKDAKCKICRRAGKKLFLKGEKCFLPKCPMIKKAYPPGNIKKRRRRNFSEYGKELREKQKLRNWYGLGEKQFSNYVKDVLEKTRRTSSIEQNPAEVLIKRLEIRLDNVIFRLGFAANRNQARQMVSHGHFLINEKRVDIPSFHLEKGDKITIRSSSQAKELFQKLKISLKKYEAPNWLDLDKNKLQATVIGFPTLEEVAPPAEISSIFEFYSR